MVGRWRNEKEKWKRKNIEEWEGRVGSKDGKNRRDEGNCGTLGRKEGMKEGRVEGRRFGKMGRKGVQMGRKGRKGGSLLRMRKRDVRMEGRKGGKVGWI